MEDKNEERTDFIGGNVAYAIVFTLFSFGYVFTAVAFPEGLNIPLSCGNGERRRVEDGTRSEYGKIDGTRRDGAAGGVILPFSSKNRLVTILKRIGGYYMARKSKGTDQLLGGGEE